MRSVTPSIESAVSRLAPGFRALSIVVESAPVADPAVAEQALAEACLAVLQDDVPWAQAHLAAIDPVVDIYNAISIRYAVPVGGENLAAYRGEPRLAIARGDEPFDTLKSAEPVVEYPEPGEVIWRDDIGVTCRRWNWRQGVRTRLDSGAQTMWFILESLPAMPLSALHEAGERLVGYLQQLMPGARASITLLRADDEGDLR
ncbi:TPA: hypothetical protein MIV73_16845 [Klebsiella pneumoniae]|uniref:B3/B4 domain-containing protein n=1 Tax=Klebsiella TaxID=570 RepID=UPI000B4152ED|nr:MULTISPECIES: phenylalanine--tRNA ligase beta subunit-related protein [Klebsiella]EKU2250098.1 hypothetical protein [Klebsiella pneumoniae]EKV7465141.1 hypothetical protein [Klebsiella pneumoniae]EKY0469648.1 hypothetical protein [Klebsiella pneumoniae]ELA0373973.1 hypothetical protein [Klebsiella pneumoniae]ELA0969176.1 hypothetical protein [Klebsiella pneumoniae]